MKVEKIPLAVRLERLKNGASADPKYDLCIIRRWAKMPVYDFMAAFEEEFIKLQCLLEIPEEERESVTYKEIAGRINERYLSPEPSHREDAVEAIELLRLPFERFMEGRVPFVHDNNE